jgi:DNA (cytosine-5)-methyltransferase 1
MPFIQPPQDSPNGLDAKYINRILSKKKQTGKIAPSDRPHGLDLFCGAGGAARGYHIAGFYMVGVDNRLQPHYAGSDFIRANAISYLETNLDYISSNYEFIHASPPCQLWVPGSNRDDHRDLITPLRPLLQETGLPYVIENVKWTPLQAPPNLSRPLELCGAMFGLGTYRDRWFESNFPIHQPPHPRHVAPDEMMTIAGRFAPVERAAWAMGINWMNRDELGQSVPPAYTSYIGTYLLKHLGRLDPHLLPDVSSPEDLSIAT